LTVRRSRDNGRYRYQVEGLVGIARTLIPMNAGRTGLVGDIGATNSRFALADTGGDVRGVRVFATDDYASLGDAIAAYLAAEAPSERPTQAVMAVAAPVTGDEVTLTNHPWTFSAAALRERFALSRVRAVNDFVANALAIPQLRDGDLFQVGGGRSVAGTPIGVVGPGSGLGVSALVPNNSGGIPINSEGGHVTMSAADAREGAVLDLMRGRFEHVSAERVLSGPGLVNLYNALCELSGKPAAQFTAAQITDPQIGENDLRAREATQMFCAMLGTVAGNLALTLGARGGIYIAGGIVPKLGDTFAQSQFRSRFESKGRFRDYLALIPTCVITRPSPALVGAATLLEQA
jgi:glucokinase